MKTRFTAIGLSALIALVGAGVVWAAGRPVTPIGQISAKDVGAVMAISGVVSDAGNFSAGFKFVISDATGAMPVTLFTRLYDEIDAPARLNVGALVTITGKLNQYKGALELAPARLSDVQIGAIVAPAPAQTQTTGRITARQGERVVISGTIAKVEPFKSGVKLIVDDGSGPRRVTLFNTVRERIPFGDRLAAGARVRVIGKVNVYRKVAEIAVALPYDVTVLESKK